MSTGQQQQQQQHDPSRWVQSPKGVFYWRHDFGSYWKGPPDDRVWVPSMDTPLHLPSPPDVGAVQGDAAGAPPGIQFGSNMPINPQHPNATSIPGADSLHRPSHQLLRRSLHHIRIADPKCWSRAPALARHQEAMHRSSSETGNSCAGTRHVATMRVPTFADRMIILASTNGAHGMTLVACNHAAITAPEATTGPAQTIARGSMLDGNHPVTSTPNLGARTTERKPTSCRKGRATSTCESFRHAQAVQKRSKGLLGNPGKPVQKPSAAALGVWNDLRYDTIPEARNLIQWMLTGCPRARAMFVYLRDYYGQNPLHLRSPGIQYLIRQQNSAQQRWLLLTTGDATPMSRRGEYQGMPPASRTRNDRRRRRAKAAGASMAPPVPPPALPKYSSQTVGMIASGSANRRTLQPSVPSVPRAPWDVVGTSRAVPRRRIPSALGTSRTAVTTVTPSHIAGGDAAIVGSARRCRFRPSYTDIFK
ncbi:hypothetical protein C8F04DRAFT_1266775 [Mycena alexandri]|uniref:Uncharacterized protein n=1 Tax=Mycena alexandri TaxID=1745969 RepID=A0AAD6SIV7_9AGAR|nr:hypothetical protein C8F04DRAFT_1266775 [Mycena alexandri]